MKTITVSDLKNQIGTTGPRPILFCNMCHSEFSANQGDYFAYAPETKLTCCRRSLRLVFKRTAFVPA